jgi:hypothetical protein
MITHEEAKAILNQKVNKYSDEEVKIILEILNRIAQIELTFLKTKK